MSSVFIKQIKIMQTLGYVTIIFYLLTYLAKIYAQCIHNLIMVQSCQTKLHQSKAVSGFVQS